VLRRLFPGANPDLEVADALARLGSDRVAAPFGWIETEIGGEPVLLGVLSEFLAHASDGWKLATQTLGRLYARQGAYGQEYLTAPVAAELEAQTGASAAASAADGLPFAAEARQLGTATAQMHVDMATAFGRRAMTPDELAALAATLTAKLDQATTVVPELAAHAGRIRAVYDEVAGIREPVMLQRIHGDYHLGQVMLSEHGWVALDFEGEPAAPLAERRALAPPLRDVAGMLRSFEYAARHQLIARPDAAALAPMASGWVRRNSDAFCAGYAAAGGLDPAENWVLLRAMLLDKAVYEVIYEARNRPSWVSIPLESIAEL
jgi:maltokinase